MIIIGLFLAAAVVAAVAICSYPCSVCTLSNELQTILLLLLLFLPAFNFKRSNLIKPFLSI